MLLRNIGIYINTSFCYRINTKVTYKLDETVYNYKPLRREVSIILLSPFIFQNILYYTMITAFRWFIIAVHI